MAVRQIAGLACAAAVVAACSPATPGPKLPIATGAIELHVTNTTFAPARLTVAADQAFEVYFDNGDTMPHNVVIIAADGRRVFAGEVFTGPAQRLIRVPALAPGVYRLRCDIHLEMVGELEAVASSAQASP